MENLCLNYSDLPLYNAVPKKHQESEQIKFISFWFNGLFWKRLDWGYICHIFYSRECFSWVYFSKSMFVLKTHDSLPQMIFSNSKEITLTWHLWEIPLSSEQLTFQTIPICHGFDQARIRWTWKIPGGHVDFKSEIYKYYWLNALMTTTPCDNVCHQSPLFGVYAVHLALWTCSKKLHFSWFQDLHFRLLI